MMKKCLAALLLLVLSLTACFALADEDFTRLNETDIELQLVEGMERKELTEEDIARGILDRFEDEKSGRIIEVRLTDEFGASLEECFDIAQKDPKNTEIGNVTSLNDLNYVAVLSKEDDILTKYAIMNPEKGKMIQISISPYDYDNRDVWRPIEMMLYSLRKAK